MAEEPFDDEVEENEVLDVASGHLLSCALSRSILQMTNSSQILQRA
jgi:hypothetical protein